MKQQRTDSILRLLLGAACTVVILAGVKASASVLDPVLLAFFILMITLPVLRWLRDRGIRAWLAYTIVSIGVIVSFLGLFLFLSTALAQLAYALPAYAADLEEQRAALRAALEARGIDVALLSEQVFSSGAVLQFIAAAILGLVGMLSNAGLVVFIYVFLLIEIEVFGRRLRLAWGNASDIPRRMAGFAGRVGVYMGLRAWFGAIAAVLDTILLLVLGVDFALLWGVLSFLMSFIPNIGYIISLIPPLLLAWLDSGLSQALLVLIGYQLINGGIDSVIAPRYMGEGLDLSTLVTVVAVFFWAYILGPIGAFLALPMTAMVRELILAVYGDTQGLALLISSSDGTAPAGTETTPEAAGRPGVKIES